MSHVYKGNGQWEYRPSSTPTTGSSNSSNSSNSSSSSGSNSSPTITNNSNRETTESSNTATSEFISIEQNVLVGDLVVVPDPSYKAKHTVLLQYLGKNLTGLYFVDQVVHSFGSDGYTQSMRVSRNGFGDTIKSGNAGKPVENVAPTQGGLMNGTGDTSRPSQASPPPTPPKVTQRTYTIKSGDTLWAIATKYYGNGSQYTKIYDANRGVIKNPNLIYPGQVIVIP